MGWHLSLRYGQVILVSGYPILTARLSHKLPMNPKKVADKCLKVAKKLLFFSKSCQKVAEFPKSCRKVAKIFLLFVPFWVLKIKNSHIASYQNFICQSLMIISEVLSISLDQQIVYQNDMNKTWLYTHIMSRTVFMWRVALHSFNMKSIHVWLSLMTSSHQTTTNLFLWFWL